ncbi:GNAT family N-acetyltransferase [Acidipila sp. EB88]|nr:GNAT family N-acetyltransferase [Acidipila sp. EB88]
MPIRVPLEILDLRHFSAQSLRPVLDAETAVWAHRLDWDYRASCNLLLQYLDARVLPGFVAVEDGRVVGYAFCVYEDRKAVIGDVFALADSKRGYTQAEIEETLLRHLLSLLQNSPGVERIEAQLLLHPHDTHAALFQADGFMVCRRTFMELQLGEREWRPGPVPTKATPADALAARGLLMRPWQEADFQLAGSLIANAYEGHLDSRINDQYRSVAGSLKFLHNIIRFPGCGVFDALASHVLQYRETGALAGLVLCSRVHKDVEHVTQLCVAASARGEGLGTLLLERAAAGLAARGFRKLSLTVTTGNERAAALYRRVGFREHHSFDAMVWTNMAGPDESTTERLNQKPGVVPGRPRIVRSNKPA